MSGIIEINLGGRLRTLSFNNWQKEALGKLYGEDPLEVATKINEKLKESSLLVVCDLIYTALIGSYRVQHKDIDFTIETVIEWVGDMQNEDIKPIFTTWVESTGITRHLIPEDKKKEVRPVKQRGKKSRTSR